MSKKNKKKEVVEEEVSEATEEKIDWDGIEPEEASNILKGIEALIPGIVKKTLVQGVNNVLFNDEGIRSSLNEKQKLPKEAMSFLLSQGDAMRKEILRMVSNEVRVFLENMDFGGEIAKILTTLSFEIKTEVRFIPNDERVRPQVKNSVKVKRQKDEGKSKAPESEDSEAEEPLSEDAPKKAFSRWRRRGRSDEEE